MIALTLEEVARAVGGSLFSANPTGRVTGSVEFDSRKVSQGGLFVAFPGERVDGHEYAKAAIAAGAMAVLGTRVIEEVPTILVDDAQIAMGRLAREVLSRLPELTVIGITGSSGKTTTKDLLAGVLGRLGPTVAPPGSFNNELGLPYTALRVDQATKFLVLEMGSRGLGHLRYLCQIAPPRIGVVVNVGLAHIGEFGAVEQIAQAKGELIEAVPDSGLAVLNADDPLVAAMRRRSAGRVVLAGEAPEANVRALDVTMDARGCASYTLAGLGDSARVQLAVPGRHQVGNSLLVAAVAAHAGMSAAQIAAALGELKLVSARRMDVFERPDGVTVIDDSYNANPASMEAALKSLSDLGRGRRTIAVLGYMAELGAQEEAEHQKVGRLVARLGVDLLIAVGKQAAPIHDGAVSVLNWGGTAVQVAEQAEAVALLRDQIRSGDVVLVKGSRYRTWEVVDALRVADRTAEARA